MISGCFAVEEHDADKEIFKLNEIVLKEGFESINLGPNLTEEYQEKLGRLVNEFNDSTIWNYLIQHQIKLTPEVPVTSKPYQLPYTTGHDLKKAVQEMLTLVS